MVRHNVRTPVEESLKSFARTHGAYAGLQELDEDLKRLSHTGRACAFAALCSDIPQYTANWHFKTIHGHEIVNDSP